VIAPAKTGRDRRSNREVIPIDQPNNGNRSNFKPSPRILKIVVIKLIEAKIDEMPAKCKEKIARSTEGPACAILLDKGG
jgi:hypothetical protein